MRVKSYTEAVRLARCAGEDAANRRMRKAGGKAWTDADFAHATRVTNQLLTDLGFDIPGWVATAGLPRNEPEEPVKGKASKRRRLREPQQLSFAFMGAQSE